MKVPDAQYLPTVLLAACFNKTSATYKYYWFLSILQEVEKGHTTIPKIHLFARMISNAWFTVNYFHISFGKQDLIQDAIKIIKQVEGIPIDESPHLVFDKLVHSPNRATQNQLWHFNNNVPHWFLSPWFPNKNKTTIYRLSQSYENKCPYALYADEIKVNPEWINYLNTNIRLLKDYCYWNLSLFLQSKNPNVPDIPNKLIKPGIRNSLTKQRKQYWDLVLKELGYVTCIYTGEKLTIGNYVIEHFIPYQFVSHDLIWNLIPADRMFNVVKNDKLPPLEKYFDSFFEIQNKAIEIVSHKTPNNKLLEDYLTLFPDLQSITKESYRERIQPLILIAANNGFEYLQ